MKSSHLDCREICEKGASHLACRPGLARAPTKGHVVASVNLSCNKKKVLWWPPEHGQLRRYHGRHLFPHPLLINQQYDYPASGSKKTLWQNRERCYKGFIDHHQRTSCEAFVRGPRTSQNSFIARGSKACSRGPEGPLRWWIDGSAYSFAKQQRQLPVRDRIRGGSIARLRTSCRSREK
jgi:hypothetical protein